VSDLPEKLTVLRKEGTSSTVTLVRAADPGAPTVLVVPAMGMRAGYYGPLLSALAEAGVTAAVMELRGHEESGGREPGWRYDFGYADLVEDLGAALDALEEAAPGPAPYLLGHSLGGQVSTAYAALHADRLSGLVYVAASSPYWRYWRPGFLPVSQAMGLLAQVVGHFPGQQVKFAGREARTLMRDWARFARTGRLRFGRPAIDYGVPLGALRLPALAVSIEGDTLGVPAAVDGLLALMPRVEATRVHVEEPGLDHFRWARRPDAVVRTVADWLKQVA